MKKFLLNLKKGFSLVECTVAMTILAFSCVLTVGIIEKANAYTYEAAVLDEMRQISNNGMEFFKHSADKEEFIDCMQHFYPQATYIADLNDETESKFFYEGSKYTLTITTIHRNADATYNAVCIKPGNELNTTMFTIDYRKYN